MADDTSGPQTAAHDTDGPRADAEDSDDERSLPRRLFQWFLDIVEFVLSLL